MEQAESSLGAGSPPHDKQRPAEASQSNKNPTESLSRVFASD